MIHIVLESQIIRDWAHKNRDIYWLRITIHRYCRLCAKRGCVALRYDPPEYADTLGGRTLPIPQGPDIQLAGHP